MLKRKFLVRTATGLLAVSFIETAEAGLQKEFAREPETHRDAAEWPQFQGRATVWSISSTVAANGMVTSSPNGVLTTTLSNDFGLLE